MRDEWDQAKVAAQRLSHDDGDESRSQRRREALAIFALARSLVELPEARLSQLPLAEDLRSLILASRRIQSHIARKRQLQYLAKQLRRRAEELPAIQAHLAHARSVERRASAELHRLERERDALIAGGDAALANFLARHPTADRNRLRQLIRRAQTEAAAGKPPAAARALFRLLREFMPASSLASSAGAPE